MFLNGRQARRNQGPQADVILEDQPHGVGRECRKRISIVGRKEVIIATLVEYLDDTPSLPQNLGCYGMQVLWS